MKRSHLILIGVVVFLWTVLMHAPAASLYAWFAPKASPVQLYGLDGDLDRGKVQALGYNGRPLLQDLHWSFQPWWLPLLRAAFHVDGGGNGLNVDGRVSLVFGGVNLSSTRLGGGIKALLGLAGMPFLPVDGQARLDLDSLKLRQGFPQSASGSAEVHGLSWALGKSPMPLGDFKAVITTERPTTGTSGADVIKLVISTLSGPIDASGEVHLQADRNYDYDLQLKAKDNADPSLRSMLQTMGQPDATGYYHLRNRGTL
jgi:general secretion pathway protein N